MPVNEDPLADRARSPAVVFAATLVLTVVGSSTFNILPLLTVASMHTLDFSDRQVGVLSVAITVGSGVGAALAGMWVRSLKWRHATAIALGGMLASNSLAVLIHRYAAFVLIQGAVGFFSSSVFCLGMTILSDRRESARGFGISFAMQVAFQIAVLLAGPTLLRLAGLNGLLFILVAISGLTLFLVPLLPTHGRTVSGLRASTELFKAATCIGLLGVFSFDVNIGAYWTYIEIMGEAQGMTPHAVANCMAAGVSAGILGGVLACALGERFGRLWPIGIAALVTVVAALLVSGSFSVPAYAASVLLYFLASNFCLPYLLAAVNAVDTTGRAVAFTQAFGYLGVAAGAGLAALFVSPGDHRAVIWETAISVCLAIVLCAISSAAQRHSAAPVHIEV